MLKILIHIIILVFSNSQLPNQSPESEKVPSKLWYWSFLASKSTSTADDIPQLPTKKFTISFSKDSSLPFQTLPLFPEKLAFPPQPPPNQTGFLKTPPQTRNKNSTTANTGQWVIHTNTKNKEKLHLYFRTTLPKNRLSAASVSSIHNTVLEASNRFSASELPKRVNGKE